MTDPGALGSDAEELVRRFVAIARRHGVTGQLVIQAWRAGAQWTADAFEDENGEPHVHAHRIQKNVLDIPDDCPLNS